MTRSVTAVRLAAICFCWTIASTIISADDRPNFVVIYVDDLGWADTSVRMMNRDPDSASDFHQTPNLEALARRGIKFSCAYAPAPTCTPSRKSIQFGKSPARLKYTFVHDVLALERKLKWKEETSLADILKAADPKYATAHFGKGMGGEQMVTIGYDETDEFDGNATNDNFHGEFVGIKNRIPLPITNPKRMPSLKKSSLAFIEKHAGNRPFFLMISHYAVHVPHAARPELIEKYRKLPRGKYCKDEDYLPSEQISRSRKISSWRLQYAAMIEEVDEGLGSIVSLLEKKKQLENTFIIFTSDNGGGLTPNGSLRGGKANLYEGGLRVPFVVAGPNVKRGAQCDVPIVQWDLLPTLHDLSNSSEDLPVGLDGGSLKDVFEKGNQGEVSRSQEHFVFHYPCYFAPPLSVIRKGDFKLMRHLLSGEQKMFNVVTDYREKNNLIDKMPAVAAKLQKEMASYLQSINAEDIHKVYEARFAELARFESMAREKHARLIEQANGDPKKIADADAELQMQLRRFGENRKDCRRNMQGKSF